MTASGTTSDNEWQWVVQRVTTNDNEWYKKWPRVTASNTASDNEWQQTAMIDSEWSSGKTNENGTIYFKEWMIAVLSMTKTGALLLQGMDGYN